MSNNEVTEYTLVNLATDLRVSKSDSPDPVTVGNRLTYTVTVTNDGPSAATGVTLVDTLPGNVSLDSATPSQGNCSGTSTVNCSLGPLANSASATVIIAVTPTTTETLTNTVSVSGNETDPDTLDNTTEEGTRVKDVVVADLSVSKSDSPDPVMVGGRLTYTVVITNNGPSTATGVTLIDTLPGNVFFGSATPSQGNCDGTSTMNCDLGTLNDGAVAMVTVVVNPTTAGIVTNTVSVTSNETDSNMDDNLDISVTTSESPSCPRSLEDVQISGPDSGYINAIYVFHSVITPSDATLPITYTWTPEPDSEQGMSNVAYQWISSGGYTLALVAENCPPSSVVTVSDTHTITISATPSTGDAYEPDDTCEQAQSILTDGTIQIHTFHDSDDEDWISFQATQGVTYVIQARVPAASSADIVAELYSDCSGVVRPGEDPPFSPDIRLIVRFPADGTYHLHFLNHDSGVYGPDVEYNVSVRALNPTVNPGALVIVAGRLYDDDALDLQENIQNVSNAVYRLFRSKSYPPERIYYLATDLNIDANGDHVPDVNALASKTNLEYAITQWTMDKGLGPDRALTLYFMDHGGEYGTFYLDNPRGERVTALALAGWLDQVETNAPGVKINVIFEACYSGGFIGGLQSSPWPGQSRWAAPSQLADWSHVLRAVSSPDRVVIASTEAFALAYASPDGAWFSDTFLGALAQDMSLAEAFQEGADAALQVNPAQIAWIDGDGDGWPNEQADYQEAAQRGFAFAGSFADDKWPAYISYAEVRNLDEGRGEIWAEVHDDQEVAEVRAIVYPPSYQPPTSGDQLVPSPLPVNLFSQGNNQYGVLYTSFDEMGEYRIVVYAKDNEGLQARPREVLVRTGWLVYVPAVLKD